MENILVDTSLNKLEQLRSMTTVVADTGDIELIRQLKPVDATTNPSLIYKAAQQENYQELIRAAKAKTLGKFGTSEQSLDDCISAILINIAQEILEIIPGRVSLEVDAKLSFDTSKTLDKANQLIDSCANAGLQPERLLIKIASTWEGIQAAKILEREGINCNCTLVFSSTQAIACADAGVFLISPFVGRIYDWYVQRDGLDDYKPEQDAGVLSVKKIYNYFKQHNYKTIVMGASFRSTQQIEQLAGCDNLTISPSFLQKLENDLGPLERKLDPGFTEPAKKLATYLEPHFRWEFNQDKMASDKLAEGIRLFANDNEKLKQFLINFD